MEGKKCMDKMIGSSREGNKASVMEMYNGITTKFDPAVLGTSRRIIEETNVGAFSSSSP